MLAVEGTKVSVIGGSAAAEVVLTRQVRARAGELAGDAAPTPAQLRQARAEVAGQFDDVHSVDRAFEVGSVDAVVRASELRPAVIGELQAAAVAQLVS